MDNQLSNLIELPWIPVRDFEGTSELVGLETLFRHASKYRDLECTPHERISLFRLLICITQASLGAPGTPDDWGDFGHDLEEKVCQYLRRAEIYPQFQLFGNGSRFLQKEVNTPKPVSASKLIMHLASGHNPTLLDHEGGTTRSFSPSFLALALLTFQCYYPLYGSGHKGRGPCGHGNMVHTFIIRKTLKETVLSNCLTAGLINRSYPAGIGQPLWELDPEASNFSRLATQSYLGRLVPRHRNLKLLSNGTGFFIEKKCLKYPAFEQIREPTATVIVVKKNSGERRKLLDAQLDKAVWRDLHTITVLKHSKLEEIRAPFNLYTQHCVTREEDIPLWIGGLVTKNSKIDDSLESSLTVPKEMLIPEGRTLYEDGIQFADQYSEGLYAAVKKYYSNLYHKSAPHKSALIERAQKFFWNLLDSKQTILRDLVRNPDLLDGKSFGEGLDSWTGAVRSAVRDAYTHTCPYQSIRQHRAFAAGWKKLFPAPSKKKKKREK